MPATVLKGISVVNAMKGALAARAAGLAASGAPPRLAIVRVGDRPDDEAYARGAIKRCESFGIECGLHTFDANVDNGDFLAEFARINGDGSVHGILVMSPLPAGIDGAAVKALIDPQKDVDCMSTANAAKIFAGDMSGHAPCTPAAVIEILKFYDIPISGSRVTLVGRSLVVGRPLAMLLLAEHATLTVCHTRTRDLAAECARADILIAAAGKAKMIGGECVKPGAAVIDVGINVTESGALCGDVDYESASAVAGSITPAPGGVGAVTTAMLARNVINACEALRGLAG
ncbi:MAG: bifunctional 5,10-methylenetetrahydrofolate dehydrogenase/5,10-methenyltetrahydrofolate cyclohydrolase [Oscillospiraceae bacterium]|nr:bifunctional 5,10-methylenetetrahydrofolate dehydrogenase/5,10-methenyltetrahydrofolate cyclohydrolase [Oscillospiraceae bacterium]